MGRFHQPHVGRVEAQTDMSGAPPRFAIAALLCRPRASLQAELQAAKAASGAGSQQLQQQVTHLQVRGREGRGGAGRGGEGKGMRSEPVGTVCGACASEGRGGAQGAGQWWQRRTMVVA